MVTSRLLLLRRIELRERGGEGGESVGCHQFIISGGYSSNVTTTFLSVPYFYIEKLLIKLCLPIPIDECFIRVFNSGDHQWDDNVSVYENRKLVLGPCGGVHPIVYEPNSVSFFDRVLRGYVGPCRLCQVYCPDTIAFGHHFREPYFRLEMRFNFFQKTTVVEKIVWVDLIVHLLEVGGTNGLKPASAPPLGWKYTPNPL